MTNFSPQASKLWEEIVVTDRQMNKQTDIFINSSPIRKSKLPLTPLALLGEMKYSIYKQNKLQSVYINATTK